MNRPRFDLSEDDDLSDDELQALLDTPPPFKLPPMSLREAIELCNADQVQAFFESIPTEATFLDRLMDLHYVSVVRRSGSTAVSAYDWFEAQGLDIGRYAMYLHREFRRERIERLEEILEIVRPSVRPRIETAIDVELTELARLEDLCPGDP